MKFLISSMTLCFFLFTMPAMGQEKQLTTKDSINTFYTKLFEELKANYLNTKSVDWPAIQSYTMKEALKSKTLEESLKHYCYRSSVKRLHIEAVESLSRIPFLLFGL